jgi:multicomponent Na+:H+ antiporter subunit G
VKEVFEALLILIACFFCLGAALGAYRFPDFFTRMHAAGKVSCFGIGFLLLALIVKEPSLPVVVKSILCLYFVFLTAPISAHVLMKVAYRRGVHRTPRMKVDEYKNAQ